MKNLSDTLWSLHGAVEAIDWDEVYGSELSRIFNYFLYKTSDRELAQDLAATTFERAWRLRPKYRSGAASLPTWLFGIARNVLREHLRGRRREGAGLEAAAHIQKIPAGVDPETTVQQQEERDRLRGLLRGLAEREQELIALKYGARLTNREIARITGFSESNVGSILHRVVTELRRRWNDENGR